MKTRFTLRIDENILKKIKIFAINENMTVSDFIVFYLQKQLESQGYNFTLQEKIDNN